MDDFRIGTDYLTKGTASGTTTSRRRRRSSSDRTTIRRPTVPADGERTCCACARLRTSTTILAADSSAVSGTVRRRPRGSKRRGARLSVLPASATRSAPKHRGQRTATHPALPKQAIHLSFGHAQGSCRYACLIARTCRQVRQRTQHCRTPLRFLPQRLGYQA